MGEQYWDPGSWGAWLGTDSKALMNVWISGDGQSMRDGRMKDGAHWKRKGGGRVKAGHRVKLNPTSGDWGRVSS